MMIGPRLWRSPAAAAAKQDSGGVFSMCASTGVAAAAGLRHSRGPCKPKLAPRFLSERRQSLVFRPLFPTILMCS